MAISATQYYLVRSMFENGLLPRGGALLEIGEANWYDLDPLSMIEDIERFVTEPSRRAALIARLRDAVDRQGEYFLFDIAKVFYDLFFDPSEMQALDFEGTPGAHRFDLNQPVSLERRFDVVINHGTAEHIFNVARVFKTAHDHAAPQGLMIHESPFTDWIEHGFYNLQPALYFDLAEANGYDLLGMFIEEFVARTILQIRTRDDARQLAAEGKIGPNAMLFVVFQKSSQERPFQIPIQAEFRAQIAESRRAVWSELGGVQS